MKKTGIVKDRRYMDHNMGAYHPESPKRLEVIYSMLEDEDMKGRFFEIEPREAEKEEICYVHSESYLEMIAKTEGKPYVSLDPDTSTCSKSYRTALLAAGGLCEAIKKVIQVVGKLLKPVWDAAKFIGKHLWGAFKKIALLPFNIIIGGIRKFGDSLKRIFEITIGMNLDRLLWGLGRRLRDIGAMAADAAVNFQLLSIRMRGLLLQETMENNVVDYAGALDLAAEKAEKLVRWISKTAVETIFGAEEIANVYTLAMSYDYTSDRAKEITESVLNFATGMGLGNQEMQRIIENFGQMKAQGKLAGTELRDLARGAFVPVNAVLMQMDKNLGLIADVNLPSITIISKQLKKLHAFGKLSTETLEKLDATLETVGADGEITYKEFKKLAEEVKRIAENWEIQIFFHRLKKRS